MTRAQINNWVKDNPTVVLAFFSLFLGIITFTVEETISILHKRISELEANQFFEYKDGTFHDINL
jgi:hypothetical protein